MKSNEQGDDCTIETYRVCAFAELVAFTDDTFADKEHRQFKNCLILLDCTDTGLHSWVYLLRACIPQD